MKILIADDDRVGRHVLERTLLRWGHQVLSCADGQEVRQLLEAPEPPRFLILDWMMPAIDGTDLCRQIRQTPHLQPCYIILLTARGRREDIVVGIEAGADDYVVKPFDRDELRARVCVGIRVIQLELALAGHVKQLEDALLRVKRLHGLLPICSYCKKIRDDSNYWRQVEAYISEYTDVQFSHGICPDCFARFVEPELSNSPA